MSHRRSIALASLWAAAIIAVFAQAQPTAPATLESLCGLALERHPKLQQVLFAIDAARGKALQAGLYPNPQLQIYGDELGDRTGPSGIWTAPSITQEIVTGKKLPLSRAAACKEVDQATLAVAMQRFALMTAVRQAYFDVLAVERKVAVSESLVRAADRNSFRENLDQVAKTDVAKVDLERDRCRADLESLRREVPAARRRLAAAVGVPCMPDGVLVDSLDDPLPPYDLESARKYVLCVSPELQSARLGVDRARLLVCRAKAEVKPNVTVGGNYVRQGQNKSNDFGVSLTMPILAWNRNQGNIQAAQANLGDAIQEVCRVEIDLADRVAAAFRDFESARKRAESYRDVVVPQAKQLAEISEKAYQAGKLDFDKLYEARRSVDQSILEQVKSQADAWKAAAAIAGLAMEEPWPPLVAPADASRPSQRSP